MKFSYKFSNLYGTVYRTGDLVFSPDGNTLLSPVGNKISMFDLKNHKSETLPIGKNGTVQYMKTIDIIKKIKSYNCIKYRYVNINRI
jgi:glucose/arabinose dehydrogenase